MSIKNRTIAVVCGLALAATALAPAAALAADNTGTTEVTVQAQEPSDQDPSAGQLSFTVPTVIPFAAKANGTLVGPSADKTQIVNKSVFPIHVTKMTTAAADGWNLVDSVSSTSPVINQLSLKFHGATASSAGVDLSHDNYWNMGYVNSENASVNVDPAGDVANVNLDLTTPNKAATITWTLAAGAAPQQ